MLVRLARVQNVGRFINLDHPGRDEVRFRQLTMLFARNSAGKSTLAHILSASARRDANALLERKTLGSDAPPQVVLRRTAGTVRFDGATWAGDEFQAHVYDRTFVEKNVFVGRRIAKAQRSALLEVALGADEAGAARRLKELDVQLRDVARKVRESESWLGAVARDFELSLDAFLRDPEDADPNAAVVLAEARLQLAHSRNDVLRRARPEAPRDRPELPLQEYAALLGGGLRYPPELTPLCSPELTPRVSLILGQEDRG